MIRVDVEDDDGWMRCKHRIGKADNLPEEKSTTRNYFSCEMR